MRTLSYGILGILLALVLGGLSFTWIGKSSSISELDDKDYRRVNAYLLSDSSPVIFNFPSAATNAKMLFYALIPQSPEPQQQNWADQDHRFTIEYRVGSATAFTRVELNTRLTQYRHLETGQTKPTYRLTDLSTRISDGRSLEFSIPVTGKKSLEIRLVSKDMNINEVVFRSYYRESSTLRDSQRRWARLSQRDQDRLARFHPLGRQYISEDEVRNVLSNRNQVIAPSGVAGKDFLQRTLWAYQFPDLLINEMNDSQARESNLGGGLRQSLRVVKATELEISYAVSDAPSALLTSLYRQSDGASSPVELGSVSGEGRIRKHLEPGDYIFDADRPIRFDVQHSDDTQSAELRRRFYPIGTTDLYYRLSKSAIPQSIKLDVVAQPNADLSVGYEFRSESGGVLTGGTIEHQEPEDQFTTRYQAEFTGDATNHRVSSRSEHVVSVPVDAVQLMVFSRRGEGLVRISNSLDSLTTKVAISGEAVQYFSRWFELTPTSAIKPVSSLQQPILSEKERSVWLVSYDRFVFAPNAEAPQVHRLDTDQSRPFFELLEPVEVRPSLSPRAITYLPIDVNQDIDIDLKTARRGDNTRVLRAFYKNEDNKVRSIDLVLNGQRYSYPLLSKAGMITLPPLSDGRHRLRIEASIELEIYLNHRTAEAILDGALGFKQRRFFKPQGSSKFAVGSVYRQKQTLQILVAGTHFSTPFNLDVWVGNKDEAKRLRRITVVPKEQSQVKLLNTAGQSHFRMIPPIYVPLNTLSDWEPDYIEIASQDKQIQLISAALLDRSGADFNRSFSDNALNQ